MDTNPERIHDSEILTKLKVMAKRQGHPEYVMVSSSVIRRDFGMSNIQFLKVLAELKRKSFIVSFRNGRSQFSIQ